jgi:hypothetical protein
MDGRQVLLASDSRIPSGVRRNIADAVVAIRFERGVSSDQARCSRSRVRSIAGAVGNQSGVLPALLVHVMPRWVGVAGIYRRPARGGVCVAFGCFAKIIFMKIRILEILFS